jgi:hypothetical protein
MKNQQVLLARHLGRGAPTDADFKIVETELREPNDGELVIATRYLSLDPYMRGRMSTAKSYAKHLEIGDVMLGSTVGEVTASRNPRFAVGDVVASFGGWQQYEVTTGKGTMKIDASKVPMTAYLGPMGMTGVTAWYGLMDIGKPKAGETFVVAAASGAVGGIAGQLAKLHGCRAVGIAGGKEKCDYVTRELGFDACLDHRDPELEQKLAEATPNGIDIYFENVGGVILDLVLARLNSFARIPLCGLISNYNAAEPYAVKNFGALLTSRATLRGFIVTEAAEKWGEAVAELAGHVIAGRLKYREDITEGLANAPKTFIGMLEGKNFGKVIVKI